MSWQIVQRNKITGKETVMAEVMTKEEAEDTKNTIWRSYVDMYYSAYVDLTLKEIYYKEGEDGKDSGNKDGEV